MLENENYLTRISKSSQISDELIKAMDLIASARDNELAFDKTITAEIVKLNDAELGEYYVKYQHGMFKAYVLDEKITYREGDTVYVKIPQGDFSSNKKIIEGKTKISSLSEADYDYLANQIVEMNVIYKDDQNIYSLNASTEEQELIIYENKEIKSTEDFINLFNAYPRIKISGDFKTIFPNKNTPFGEFGLKIDFYYKSTSAKNSISYYVLQKRFNNIHNFIGNLNEYLVFSPQYALYDFKDMNMILTGIKKISLYTKNYNSEIDYSVEGAYNINVQNIKISFMDKIDDTDSMYYIGIRANDGTILMNDTSSLSLEGLFYYSGKELISDKTKCQCFWYRRNPEVTEYHKNYDKNAGPGWEKVKNNVLERLENGEITASQARAYLDSNNVKTYALYGTRLNLLEQISTQWRKEKESLNKSDPSYNSQLISINENYQQQKNNLVVEFQPAIEHNILHIRGMDVYQEMEYKFIVLYGQEKRFSKVITITKNNIQRFNLIKSMTQEGLSVLQLYDLRQYEGEEPTVANWYVELSNGDYYSCESNSTFMEIGPYQIYPEATFYANIILSETQKIPMKYKIKSYLSTDDIKVYFSGTDTFIYDKNYESASYGQINELKINIVTNNTRIINSNHIHWFFADNEGNNKFEITADDYPHQVSDKENSMIKTLSVNSNKNIVTVGIREHFDSSRDQNLLKLVIDTEEKSYEFTKMLNFIKQGTHTINAGAYEMTLQYYDENGQETGEQFLFTNSRSSTAWSTIFIKPKITSASGKIVEDGGYCSEISVNGSTDEETNSYTYEVKISKQQINVQCIELNDGLYSVTKTTSYYKDSLSDDKEVSDFKVNGQYFVRFCAEIKILDKNKHAVNRTVINRFFPIPLVIGDLDVSAFSEINIPRYIKYNSLGESPQCDIQTVSFKYQDQLYPLKNTDLTHSIIESNLTISKKGITSQWIITPTAKYSGSNFPLYSDIELNYEAMGQVRLPSTPMGALSFNMEGHDLKYFIWPIVMTIEGELTKEIVGYQGSGIILNTGDGTTPVAPTIATGNVNNSENSQGEFGGVVIGTESSNSDNPISGVYLYDQSTYTESNVLRTDGTFNLGAGAIICKMVNEEKKYDFDLDFIKMMVKFIKNHEDEIENYLGGA